jgi:hypothetical protein
MRLIVIFEHLVLGVFHLLVPLPGVIEGNDDTEEYDQGKSENDIRDVLCVHRAYFFFLLIMRYSTTIAAVGMAVKAMVASIEMSM